MFYRSATIGSPRSGNYDSLQIPPCSAKSTFEFKSSTMTLFRTPSFLRRGIALLAGLALASAAFAETPAAPQPAQSQHRFEIGKDNFLLDGQRLQIRCGEIHFSRVPREYWVHRLRMIKAMGLNCVSVYLFWNFHEWRESAYDWSEARDAAEFCRLAQAEGLWVLLRPGPYVCAEWEQGGLPWWLLKNRNDTLRTRDPAFLAAVERWFAEVHRVLGPLQASQGGPILMIQVENEYGFFGKDAEYMLTLKNMLQKAGFAQPFFACNPAGVIKGAHIPELFSVVNFGSDPKGAFAALRSVQPTGPLKTGEFYPGWFDTWGTPHKKGDPDTVVRDLRTMLEMNASFSLYMAHGGTTFGFWAGTDRPFRPDTSSYDYDAPISEAGWATPKFWKIRALMAEFLLPGETLPEPPAQNPVIEIPSFELKETAVAFENLSIEGPSHPQPAGFEESELSRGFAVYRTKIPAGKAATLAVREVRDFGWVYVDGKLQGVLDRRLRRFQVSLPERQSEQTLDIVVYALGRVNFGKEIHDRKGLRGPVLLVQKDAPTSKLEGWSLLPFELGDASPSGLAWKSKAAPAPGPVFWRGNFELETTGDTFLDLSAWGMGAVWINGHALGRYWNIGPCQTLYVPGPWLKKGTNEVIVLDFTGPELPSLAGLREPILERLRPEKDFSRKAPLRAVEIPGEALADEGNFPEGSEPQERRLARPVAGRQICLEALDSLDGGPNAALAEFGLLDAQGRPLEQNTWTIAYVDSEESQKLDGSALNAINGQISDCWLTELGARAPKHPHRLVIDLGARQEIGGFRYVPRQGDAKTVGRIRHYRFYVGDELAKPADEGKKK